MGSPCCPVGMMEMGAVDQFPHPIPASHCDSRREMFTNYGSMGAVSVQMLGTTAQKSHGSHLLHRLYASGPSLPLIPPRHVPDLYDDVCVRELQRRRDSTVWALNTLTVIKSHVRKDTERQRNLQKCLRNLESKSIKGETGDNTNNYSDDDNGSRDDDSSCDDDCHSLCYPVLPALADALREQLRNGTDLPKVNSRYTGGCMSCVSTGNRGGHGAALVYASGDNLCTLSISTNAGDGSETGVDENSIGTVTVDGKIYEVVTQHMGVECYCAMRQKKQCSMFRMDLPEFGCEENAKPTTTLLQSHAWSNTEETPSSICLSPYMVGECAVATDNGSVYLWSTDGRYDAVCNSIESRFSGVDNWYSCHYGAHPREIVLSDRTGVSLFDVRQPTQTVQMDLFILPNRLLHHAERVMVSAQHPTNTFLHLVATDHNLMVVDERFPSSSVLHWSHTLPSPPQYIDIISGLTPPSCRDWGPGDDLTFLASQASHETHCFQWTTGVPPQPTQATATPWRVSQAEDFVHLSRREGVLTDHSLLTRLSVSLIGICALPHPKRDGFTVFQMTAHGDICHQTYQFGDALVTDSDVTCAAGPGSDTVSLDRVTRDTCTRWQQEEERKTHAVEDTTNEWPLHKSHTSHYYPGLNTETYPHVLCSLCMPQWQNTSQRSATTDMEELCHKCGHSLLFSAQFREAVYEGVIAPSMDDTNVEIDSCLSTHDPSRFSDSTSKLLTKLWHEDYDIYHLLQQKEEEQVVKSKSDTVTVVMETPDDTLDMSHNVNSDHLIGSDHPQHKTLVVRREGADNPSPIATPRTQRVVRREGADNPSPIATPRTQRVVRREGADNLCPIATPLTQHAGTRRRSLSMSSVDSALSITARGHTKPGFHSTPPRLRKSQLPATATRHPHESSDVHNTNTMSASATPPSHRRTLEELLPPSSKRQKLEPTRCKELDGRYPCEVPSFPQDQVIVTSSGSASVIVSKATENMSDAANVILSSGITSTAKKKRRKFVIGF